MSIADPMRWPWPIRGWLESRRPASRPIRGHPPAAEPAGLAPPGAPMRVDIDTPASDSGSQPGGAGGLLEPPGAPMRVDIDTRMRSIEFAHEQLGTVVESLRQAVVDGNRTIREQEIDIARLQQARSDDLETAKSLQNQLQLALSDLAIVRSDLVKAERSKERMGRRIGKLERLAGQLPLARHEATQASMAARIWEIYSADLRRIVREYNETTAEPIALPDPPIIPKLQPPALEEQDQAALEALEALEALDHT